jgi:hypothetical protein
MFLRKVEIFQFCTGFSKKKNFVVVFFLICLRATAKIVNFLEDQGTVDKLVLIFCGNRAQDKKFGS